MQGLTEPGCPAADAEILHIFISNRPGNARPGSTGQIVPGYEAKIIDENEQELPPREVGTLLIKGDSIAAGYWNKHEQTKETFQGEWINTHDKFHMDEDGYFYIEDRKKDLIITSGFNVYPSEVEAVLRDCITIAVDSTHAPVDSKLADQLPGLNTIDPDATAVRYVVDGSEAKQGRHVPGTGQRILAPLGGLHRGQEGR